MKTIRTAITGAIIALAITVLATSAAADVHFQLVKAEPAKDATLTEAPTAIKLWFSQVPQMQGARIRLVDAGDELVDLGDVKQGAEDKKMIHASVEGDVPPGSYRIVWRAMAQDGHVQNGEVAFSVAAR